MSVDPVGHQKGEENVPGSSKTGKEFRTPFPQKVITNVICSSVFPLASVNLLWKGTKFRHVLGKFRDYYLKNYIQFRGKSMSRERTGKEF